MRKSLVGAILCVMVTYNASASIISRGFFDEAMENYATNTALDLKANQSDLVNLSNIVGTPKELTYGDIMGSFYINEIMGSVYYDTYADNTVNNISELINLNYTDTNFPGLVGVVESLFHQRDRGDQWPIRLRDIFTDYELLYNNGFYSFTELIINGGTVLDRDNVTVYGLKDLTIKIGDLPTEYATVGAALTAMDAKITAKNLPSTSDDGQYVLTAKKVGETITYTWVKMDLTNEEQIQ